MFKLYSTLWIAIAISGLGFWITGNFTMMTTVVLGFICFGMTFMGMMSVLPTVVAHPAKPVRSSADATIQPHESKRNAGLSERLQAYKATWKRHADGVEMRRPTYR